MERRTPAEKTTAAVAAVMETHDVTAETLSEATDIRFSTLREHLDNKSPFTLGELMDVGGFFRTPVSHFLEEVA
jgi:hypothetical protein